MGGNHDKKAAVALTIQGLDPVQYGEPLNLRSRHALLIGSCGLDMLLLQVGRDPGIQGA